MKTISPISMFVAVGLLGAPVLCFLEGDSFAQSSTAGSLRGVIKDKKTGEALIAATVVATSTVLQGEQVVITDESGAYFIDNLPPGTYTLTVFYNDAKFSRGNVLIQVGKQVVVNVPIDTSEAAGETIVIEGTTPIVDQGSTKTGPTITKEYTENIPVGRTFGAVLGAAAGSQGDLYGTSVSGSTSNENTYIIEGINTTDTAYGLLGSNLPNEFIQETEVITGGYNAEFGRSTGGVINVVTKQGSNNFHGSVFGYYTPGALVADAKEIERAGSAVDATSNLDYSADFGAEVGGPIIKDKLWFHAGVNPSFRGFTTTRTFSNQVDADGDGVADVNPDTGIAIKELIPEGTSEIPTSSSTYFVTAKINGAITADHQFQVAGWANPRSADDLYGTLSAPTRQRYHYNDGAYDVATKWSSKFADGKTQVDLVAGWHRGFSDDSVYDPSGETSRMFYRYTQDFMRFDGVNGESVPDACIDPDPTDSFIPCPAQDYSTGGLGFVETRTNDRASGTLAITQRVKLLGNHTFKGGLEIEHATYDGNNRYTSGQMFEAFINNRWRRRAHLAVVPMGEAADPNANPFECINLDGDDTTLGDNRECQELPNGYFADTRNRSYGGYLQDSWQIRPNLTLNAGLRWEQQIGYSAKEFAGTDTAEGETIPSKAYDISHFSPRVGLIFDPTQEGRAKVFGHWGRFYESVPMDLNVRAFGGEILKLERTSVGNTTCPDPDIATGATSAEQLAGCSYGLQTILGISPTYLAKDLKGQYLDEIIVGGEHELLPDFKMGVNYVHRELGRVIEDVSVDGGNLYVIANPGEDFSDEAAQVRAEAAMTCPDEDTCTDPHANFLYYRAFNLDHVSDLDKPVRRYDAVQVTADKRFSNNALLVASYTYSRSVGNFPGLFSTETGQLDPNITSMYDLNDLMANRVGPMGLDRPHNLKLDGFKRFDLKKAGLVTLGASFRAQSGLAQNTLGAHVFYGSGESYLLPRGAVARGPLTWQADIKAVYGRRVGSVTVETFVDVFNLFNNQAETDADEIYTTEFMNPVVGGDLEDLRHGKTLFSPTTPIKNKNWGNTSARQAPLSVRFGLRVTF